MIHDLKTELIVQNIEMFENSIETFREGTDRASKLPSAHHETRPRVGLGTVGLGCTGCTTFQLLMAIKRVRPVP